MEKYMDHQRQVYHNFIDFKKAFDRVWHEGLWNVMSEFGIGNDLIKIIKLLYESVKSAAELTVLVLLNKQIGTKFDTTVVRQCCLLLSVLFNIFLEQIMQFLTDSIEKTSTSYGMEISHEKSKILVNGDNSTHL